MSMSASTATVDEILEPLILSNEKLEEIEILLLKSFNEGLKKDTNPVAPVKMFPTYVRHVPDGKDKYGLLTDITSYDTTYCKFKLNSYIKPFRQLMESLWH